MKNYATSITVNDFDIRVKDGKIHLNDLHRLAKKLNLPTAGKTPKEFMSREDLLERPGKYVSQFLAIKYAYYISLSFSVDIDNELCIYNASRCVRSMFLTDQSSMLEAIREAGGGEIDCKEEIDTINLIVLCCTSSEFINMHCLPEDATYLDYLPDCQVSAIGFLQRFNTSLIKEGVSFYKRRSKLNDRFYSILS